LEAAWSREFNEADGEGVLDGEDGVGALGPDGMAAGTPGKEGPTVSLRGETGDIARGIVATSSAEASRGSEQLLEAIECAAGEVLAWERYMEELEMARSLGHTTSEVAPPPQNPLLLGGVTPGLFVLKALRAIAPGDIDQALLVLPFAPALSLLRFLALAMRRGSSLELASRASLLLLRVHGPQLTASGQYTPFLRLLKNSALGSLEKARDLIGVNCAGLGSWETELAGEAVASLKFGETLTTGEEGTAAGEGKGKGRSSKLVSFGKRRKVVLL